MEQLDVAHIEEVEAELDRFIDRRACERAKANAEADMWALSERKYHEREQEELRQAWIFHHLQLADSHEAMGNRLAEWHREQARRLQENGG